MTSRVPAGAVYTFLVGLSPGRPVRPDAEFRLVEVAEEDSAAGAVRAQVLAAQIVAGGCAMVTSTELVACEL